VLAQTVEGVGTLEGARAPKEREWMTCTRSWVASTDAGAGSLQVRSSGSAEEAGRVVLSALRTEPEEYWCWPRKKRVY